MESIKYLPLFGKHHQGQAFLKKELNGIKRGECNVSATQTPLVSPITQPSHGLRKRRTSRGTSLSIVKILQNRKKVMILRHYKIWKIISQKKQNPLKLRSNIYSYQAETEMYHALKNLSKWRTNKVSEGWRLRLPFHVVGGS